MAFISERFKALSQTIYDTVTEFSKGIISQGPIPKHIAFIMDGNRRYARKNGLVIQKGHIAGDIALRSIIKNCIDLGVKVVSVYAFSIDNFNRTQEEVQFLMELAKSRFEEYSDAKSNINNLGIRVIIVGNLSLLSKEAQEACELAMKATNQNKTCDLIIYLPYTSTDELAQVVKTVVNNNSCPITSEHFSIPAIEKQLYHTSKYPLDLLVRTSGETRLSDFLLWQCSMHNPLISFVGVSWPELNLLHLIPVFLKYQIYIAKS